ncbi:hypothetical protein C8F04DRAFT_1142868 [Mycena alexandri]|uniref:Secreted protein n=1 Tax=Mycena alexandri TaxID=1745969 RepID=A0AAD6S7Y3_9AGAR|nr:hypothetical protein C8F04DRAFT_1142868 [Mycena alexandri]
MTLVSCLLNSVSVFCAAMQFSTQLNSIELEPVPSEVNSQYSMIALLTFISFTQTWYSARRSIPVCDIQQRRVQTCLGFFAVNVAFPTV